MMFQRNQCQSYLSKNNFSNKLKYKKGDKMKKVIVTIEYLKREIFEPTFEEAKEVETFKEESFIYMKDLKNFFTKVGIEYNENLEVIENLENLRTLTGDIRVINIGFRTYLQYHMNVTAELPDEFDIYIDEKKVK